MTMTRADKALFLLKSSNGGPDYAYIVIKQTIGHGLFLALRTTTRTRPRVEVKLVSRELRAGMATAHCCGVGPNGESRSGGEYALFIISLGTGKKRPRERFFSMGSFKFLSHCPTQPTL
jgi:hypothetical protein